MELKFKGVKSLELTAQQFLMSAFQRETKRLKLRVMLELNFNDLLMDQFLFFSGGILSSDKCVTPA